MRVYPRELSSVVLNLRPGLLHLLQNKSSRPRSVSVVLSATSILYTGTKINKLKRTETDVVLNPGQSTFDVGTELA